MNRTGKESQQSSLGSLKQELENKLITEFTEREIFHPTKGYAKKVVEEARVTAVQLRKIFQEFKAMVDQLKKDEDIDKALARLYKLYALLEYQANRGVLNDSFKELMFKLFDNIERSKSREAFEKAYELLMAMVAYSKKS